MEKDFSNYVVADLFCGIGGFLLGFKQDGFKILFGLDNNPKVEKTFKTNFPDVKFILDDIRNRNPYDYEGKIDILIGGVPCINFSKANKDKNEEKGMELVNIFLKWVEIIKPKFWIMENVEQIKPYLHKITDLKIPQIKILNTIDYGIPQRRVRCFSGNYLLPKITHTKSGGVDLFGNKLKKWVNIKHAIKDIFYRNPNPLKLREEIGSEKMLYKHPPQKLNQSSRTIKCKVRSDMYLEIPTKKEGKKYRLLSTIELARLMSFPDDYQFVENRTTNKMLLGNAVCPKLSFLLADKIKEKLIK